MEKGKIPKFVMKEGWITYKEGQKCLVIPNPELQEKEYYLVEDVEQTHITKKYSEELQQSFYTQGKKEEKQRIVALIERFEVVCPDFIFPKFREDYKDFKKLIQDDIKI